MNNPKGDQDDRELEEEVRDLDRRFKKLADENLLPGPSFSKTVEVHINMLKGRRAGLISHEVAEARGMILVLEERAAKIRRKLRSE
ncbi:MAG: hypothetical protein KBD16_02245 [Candidatus Pacebacteria bacterium]|nr:hypothetical protein [Candidatus Paceibacterota bacterium]